MLMVVYVSMAPMSLCVNVLKVGKDQHVNKVRPSISVCIDVDECMSSPCANGGICVDGSNEFMCQCLEGWEGPTCEQGKMPQTYLIHCKVY